METTACRSRRRLTALLVWCLFLTLAWGLWTWQLDASDLTHDEAITYRWAVRPLPQIIAELREAVREHPPTYYILMRAWLALAGSSEFSLRLFSAAWGLVALVLVGWVARLSLRCFAGPASILPAILLAVTPGMVYYARVARMYTIVVALPVLSAGLFLRGFVRRRGWPHWTAVTGLALVHLVAVSTHYYVVLPMLVQPVFLLLVRRWKPFLAWCGAQMVAALAAVAWFLTSPGLQRTAGGVGLIFEVPTQFQVLHLLGKLLFSPVVRVQFGLLSVLLVLIGLGIVVAIWRDRIIGVWLLLSLLVPLAAAYAVPLFPVARLVLFILPFAALAMGTACTLPLRLIRVKPRWLTCAAALGLGAATAWLVTRGGLHQAVTHERSSYGHTLETIKAHARPGDAILFYGPWQEYQLDYYDPGGLPPVVALPPSAPPRLRPSEAEPVLHDLTERFDRLWVLPAAVSDVDPRFFVGGWLSNNAHNVWEAGEFALYLRALPPGIAPEVRQLVYGESLELVQLAHEPLPVPAGEAVRVTLTWNPLRHLERHVQMTLSLVDQHGHTWVKTQSTPGSWAAAKDTWAPGRIVTDREGFIVPEGAPPGSYTVRLRVSDAATGTPLAAGEHIDVDLFTVRVTEPLRPPVLAQMPDADRVTFCPPGEGDCVVLAGHSSGGSRFQQGYPVPITLHWLAEGGLAPDIHLRLRMVHDSPWFWAPAAPIITKTFPSPWSYTADSSFCQPPESDDNPSGAVTGPVGPFRAMLPLVLSGNGCVWPRPDRLVTVPIALLIPPDAPTGLSQMSLQVIGPDGQSWSTPEGSTSVTLVEVDIEGRPVLRRLPRDLTPIHVDFGDGLGLRGFSVQGDARPGDEVRITYVWYARQQPTEIYAVFNHLIAADGTRVAQVDGWPLEGRMLTTQWQPGEYIRDSYLLQIPPDAAPGPYTLYVGLYSAMTGDRQPAIQDGQVVPDGRVPIPLDDGAGR